MPTNNELELAVGAALLARAEAQTSLNAYLDLIPPEQALPAVRVSVLDGFDTRAASADASGKLGRILTSFDVLACVTFRSHSITSGMVAQVDALIAALDGYSVDDPTLNVHIYSCHRTGPWRQTQEIDNETYRSHGGEFHVIAQSSGA